MMNPRRGFYTITLAAACLALLLAGCGAPRSFAVLKDISEYPAGAAYISSVPFYPQNDHMCGPSSLASVIGYYGRGAGMAEVAREVYSARLKGTLPVDLLIYARDRGFEADYYSGSLDDLRKNVSGKRPLIIFLNLGLESYPVGHYVVITGYDDRLKVVVAHSGPVKDEVFSYDDLLKDWGKTGFSTLLITPKGGTREGHP